MAPCIPSRYCVKSKAEFIDTLKVNRPEGVVALLEVESLFTNVLVDRLIAIIQDFICSGDALTPPKSPETVMYSCH